MTVRAVLTEDIDIVGHSEASNEVQLAKDVQQGKTFMLKPGNSDTKIERSIMVAKQLSVINK